MNSILIVTWFSIGIFFALSIYHLLVFFGRRKDLSNLAYSLFCLLYCCALFFMKGNIEYFNINEHFTIIFNVWLMILGGVVLVFFMHTVFVYSNPKIIFIVYNSIQAIVGISLTLFYIFTLNISFIMLLYLLIAILDITLLVIIAIDIIKKKKYKKREIKIIIAGLLFVMTASMMILIIRSIGIEIPSITRRLLFILMAVTFAYALTDSFNREHRELIELKTILEKKVKDRTIELEDANTQKTNFFINFAHEIRTPLTLISNYFERYIKKTGIFTEAIIIKDNLDKLTRDMVNILDVEKLTKGQVYYDNSMIINLSDIINKKISLFREVAEKKEIEIYEIIKKNIYIKIDAFAIDRILNNLLDNAIKYNKQNGEITVTLNADNKNIILVISDTGIGIDKEQQKNIFDPYYQLSHHKRNVQGIGIGLSIVKKIIEEINGEISIKSELNKGTEFILKFKRYYLKKGDIINEDYKVSKPLKTSFNIELNNIEYKQDRYNIYVIEDNIELLFLLKESISEKYNFFYALNGKEALDKIKDIPKPHIIISDIMMDEMDGYDFFENISKNEKYKTIPFIFLTAKSREEDKLTGLIKGAIDFISKPFSVDELLAKVESIIKYQKRTNESIHKDVSNELFNYLRGEFSSIKKLNYIKKSKIEYDAIGKLYYKYGLSKKEIEIIEFLKKGLEYKEIGSMLNISKNTVSTHIMKMFNKCNVKSIKELLDLVNKSIR